MTNKLIGLAFPTCWTLCPEFHLRPELCRPSVVRLRDFSSAFLGSRGIFYPNVSIFVIVQPGASSVSASETYLCFSWQLQMNERRINERRVSSWEQKRKGKKNQRTDRRTSQALFTSPPLTSPLRTILSCVLLFLCCTAQRARQLWTAD